MPALRNRWWVLGAFLLSTSINYLDRHVLSGVAPMVKIELGLTNAQYGAVGTAFALAYSAGAPFAGLAIDRLGLTRGISLAIGVWSTAGILTGLGSGLAWLAACRALLGLGQAGGIPAAGKAIRLYLAPEERALGNSLNQAAVSLGLIVAAPLGIAIATHWHWRQAFMVTGVLGLVWIILWRAIEPRESEAAVVEAVTAVPLRDRRLWAFALANALNMVLQALWTNWTVLFLVDHAHARIEQAGWLATLPPLLATAGGAAGGWLSFRWMKRGLEAVTARSRACLIASIAALGTAAIPWMPSATLAAAGIAFSFFAVSAAAVNIYSIPLDVFGAQHAAFAISMLTTSYGAMQALVQPIFGLVIDHWGYAPLCVAASLTPLAAYGVLRSVGQASGPSGVKEL